MTIRTFNNYKEAVEYAKCLAIDHKVTITVVRDNNSFCIDVPENLVKSDEAETVVYDIEEDTVEYNYQNDYDYQETQREITEEISDYAASMARSDEEGWFHPDREGSQEDNISKDD